MKWELFKKISIRSIDKSRDVYYLTFDHFYSFYFIESVGVLRIEMGGVNFHFDYYTTIWRDFALNYTLKPMNWEKLLCSSFDTFSPTLVCWIGFLSHAYHYLLLKLWINSNINPSEFPTSTAEAKSVCNHKQYRSRKSIQIQMEVLKGSKFALRLGNLSNKNGFYLFGWRIPNFIVDFFLLLPMSICSVQLLMVCFNKGFNDLKDISNAIYLCLGIFSICSMYICLAANNDLIIATLDHLQDMMTLSEIYYKWT